MGKAFPYQLADTGKYDVWMMNQRGNFYSRQHLWLNPDTQPEFWDFSVDEIAEYDFPATVEFIQNERQDKSKMTYIGYSQGTTVGTYALALHPEYYSTKIKLFVAIAPAVLFEHTREQKLLDLADMEMAQTLALRYNYLEFDGNAPHKDDFVLYIKENYPSLCDYPGDPCSEHYKSRENLEQSPSVNLAYTDPDRFEIYVRGKSGTSIKNIIHMGQMMKFKKFQKYDHRNTVMNYNDYGQSSPPEIPLENLTIPTALYVARHDMIATVDDVINLNKILPNVVDFQILENEDHLSLQFGSNMTYFHGILELMQKY